MAKTAEERYQSANGLKIDLSRCLDQLRSTGTIEPFPLGQQDFTQNLRISKKIYGREPEIQTLLAAFERTSAGHAELMLVAGYSGIGKTVLVHEVQKPMVEKRGYFISGKFDQYTRNIPLFCHCDGFSVVDTANTGRAGRTDTTLERTVSRSSGAEWPGAH